MKYTLLLIIPTLLISMGSCTNGVGNAEAVVFGDSTYLAGVPPQPDEDTWKFIEDLKSPLWTKHEWVKTNPGPGYADLSGGVSLKTGLS